jgi:hypothetical protein
MEFRELEIGQYFKALDGIIWRKASENQATPQSLSIKFLHRPDEEVFPIDEIIKAE